MAQFVDGKDLGLDEEDVRNQMAAASGMTVLDFTQVLYDQALEEQRKGTKGLTKFLAKWRKQIAAGKVTRPDKLSLQGVGAWVEVRRSPRHPVLQKLPRRQKRPRQVGGQEV